MPRRARVGSEAWSGRAPIPDQVQPSAWPLVDMQALPQDRRALFLRRKLGIDLYFDGACEGNVLATSWPLDEAKTDPVDAGAMLIGLCCHSYRYFWRRLGRQPGGTQLRLELEHKFRCANSAAMAQALRQDMPRATLTFAPETLDDPAGLREGRIDLDVGHFRPREPEVQQLELLRQRQVAEAMATGLGLRVLPFVRNGTGSHGVGVAPSPFGRSRTSLAACVPAFCVCWRRAARRSPMEVESGALQAAVVDAYVQASNAWRLPAPLGAKSVEAF